MRALLLCMILAAHAADGCGEVVVTPDPPPTPPAPNPPPDPPPVPVEASCTTDCAHAATLGCSWALPTTKGASCLTVCQNAQNWGDKWNHGCRTTAASCADADACE